MTTATEMPPVALESPCAPSDTPAPPSGLGTIRLRRNGIWEGRLYCAPGKKHSVYSTTRAGCEAKLAALRAERDAARDGGPVALADWVANARPPRRWDRDPRISAAVFQGIAVRQLLTACDDVLAAGCLPAGLQDDLAFVVAIARAAVAEAAGEEAPAHVAI